MFIKIEDYYTLIGEAAFNTVTRSSAENLTTAERMAIEEISGYLRPVYDTQAIFSAEGADRNSVIVMYTADIALYHLNAGQPQRMGSEIRKERYDRAIKWLEGVQSGKIVPNLPTTQFEEGSSLGTSFRSHPKLNHSW